MSLRRAVIVDVCRSPFARGRENGALAPVHPVDLYAQVLAALVARTGIDPALVEDVITGCVIQVAEQAGNIGRQAVLAAGRAPRRCGRGRYRRPWRRRTPFSEGLGQGQGQGQG
jgi:acetyl-CoA acetyltransferase